MRRTITLLVLITSLPVSCGKPTIDTSSEESIKSSIEKVRQSLPEDERDEFDKALSILFMDQMVEVMQLDGADGEPLFSVCKFTQKDEKRLEKLKRLKETFYHEPKAITTNTWNNMTLLRERSDECRKLQDGYGREAHLLH